MNPVDPHIHGQDPACPAEGVVEARGLPTTLTAARDAADFVARILAEDATATVVPGDWEEVGSAQVKEEPAKRAGDTEQSPLPHSLRAQYPKVLAWT